MTKLLEQPPELEARIVGICHHGFRAYLISDGTRRLWHSGPAITTRPRRAERAVTGDGIHLALCEGRDPYAP